MTIKERTEFYKDLCFTVYGGYRCVCCGEKEKKFLTLDHIHSNGNVNRKSGFNLYCWLKNNRYPEGIQVLCFNCNCGRNLNGGICPHKQ